MESNGKVSGYNEAANKMDRLHASQRIINACRLNLLHLDSQTGLYNYEIVSAELLNLIMEARGKMNDTEKKEAELYRLKLTLFFDLKKIYYIIPIENYGKTKKIRKLNMSNWIELRKLLFTIEDFVRDTLERCGFSSFNADEDDDDAY